MKILLYYQNPYHTVFLESLVSEFVKSGHEVHFLTTCNEGILHSKMKELGANVSTHVHEAGRVGYLWHHARFLVKYCNKNRIDVVFPHLQMANLIALLAQRFLKAKVFPCRHHSVDVMLRGNRNAVRIDQWVNKLSRKIIVVSNAVKNQMIANEGVNPRKITVIPLGYDFSLYDLPVAQEVDNIKKSFQHTFRLIVIGRMTENKRHVTALKVLKRLRQKGVDAGMIIMDSGPLENEIKSFVAQNGLTDAVLFTGFVDNTMNYLAAADLLLQPSVSEASNQVVKEAAWLEIPSVVCRGVGDFDEYFIDGDNGFLVSVEHAEDEMYDRVIFAMQNPKQIQVMGRKIKSVVVARFNSGNVAAEYLRLAKDEIT